MNKEKLKEGLNLSFEGMIWAEGLKDIAQTKIEQNIATAMYEAFWCLFTILFEIAKKGKNEKNE